MVNVDQPPSSLSARVYDSEHALFRELVRNFVAQCVLPNYDAWERAGIVDRALFTDAGAWGLLGFGVDDKYGGPGIEDFRFNAIVGEEFGRALATSAGLSLTLQNDIVLPYLLGLATDEQKARWLAGTVSGETVLAVAMTEPGTGSDLAAIRTRAVRHGDVYVVNGAKTFISSGQHADLVITAVRTADDPHRGLSLLVLERGMPGFERGRNLEKIGLHAQDTSELSFTDVRVPVANLLGEENSGFYALVRNLPQERLSIAIAGLGMIEGLLTQTLAYAKERTAFGQPIGSFQHSRFVLAELATEIDIARTFILDCLVEHLRGELSAVRAAKAKYWVTELQCRVSDRCLQLYGGYGYMREYPVGRAFVDSRVQMIYGGTNEIMKEIIGRDLGL